MVFCDGGLANRLRVLVSGLAAAEVSKRTFKMLWPRTAACAASFRELFTNNWPVQDVDRINQSLLVYKILSGSPFSSIQQFTADPRQDIVLGLYHWLVDCQPQHAPDMYARCCELLYKLEPLPEITKRIIETQQYFRPTMIGVHLRRNDFLRVRPDVSWNTRAAYIAVDQFLEKHPEAGIFLCTDDGAVDQHTDDLRYEGVRDVFQTRYGNKVITTSPRSLDRRTTVSIQDALVDLWLLRSTKMIVGTAGSSFSYLSAFGREVEYMWVSGKTPAYSVIHWLAWITGMHWLVCRFYLASHGRNRPFPVAWRYLIRTLTIRWKAIIK
jgi:hypothetical protein